MEQLGIGITIQMMLAQQQPITQVQPVEYDVPLSWLAALLGLVILFGPHLVRWWKKRRDARQP